MAKYLVTTTTGAEIGADDLLTVREIVAAHPGSTVRVAPVVIAYPCTEHRSYEADNCPVCGTSAQIGA